MPQQTIIIILDFSNQNADGSFNYTNYDPLNCYGCYWGNDEYEAKPIEYGWSMLYDMETLIEFINHNNDDMRHWLFND